MDKIWKDLIQVQYKEFANRMKSRDSACTILGDYDRPAKMIPPLSEIVLQLFFDDFCMSIIWIPSIISIYTYNIHVFDLEKIKFKRETYFINNPVEIGDPACLWNNTEKAKSYIYISTYMFTSIC